MVAAVVGFHYELYRPAATQPDWSTSLSCGLITKIIGHEGQVLETIKRFTSRHKFLPLSILAKNVSLWVSLA